MNEQGSKWEIHDRYGNRVYMTRERWQHITERRPWLTDFHGEILAAVRHGRRKQDPLDAAKYKYYRPCTDVLPEYNHLVAVVRFGETADTTGETVPNNYVVTAWPVFIYGKR